ncbi:hypothetical protein D3C78_1310180 [compost metagenome]
MESVVPLPVFPATSVTPALLRVIRLVVSLMLLVGVKVAVQVMPPSLEVTLLRVPLLTLKSLLSKPLTASEKVIVTRLVSPIGRVGLAITMVAVGRAVSMA